MLYLCLTGYQKYKNKGTLQNDIITSVQCTTLWGETKGLATNRKIKYLHNYEVRQSSRKAVEGMNVVIPCPQMGEPG